MGCDGAPDASAPSQKTKEKSMKRTSGRDRRAVVAGPLEVKALDAFREDARNVGIEKLTCSNELTISAETLGKRKWAQRRPTENADQMARAGERGIGGGRAPPVLIYRCARAHGEGGAMSEGWREEGTTTKL